MGKYRSVRKCKEIGEMTVMTRARAAASVSAKAGRKRKVSSGEELSCCSRSLGQLRSRRRLSVSKTPENSTEKTAASNSNDPYASCCSSNGSTDQDKDALKFVDLEEEESIKMATSTYELEICSERRETTPSSSEVRVELAQIDSTATPSFSQANSHRRGLIDKKMPPQAELDEFFLEAEKNIRQQFAQKYNFDIAKEEPLEGRYEWVRVKPQGDQVMMAKV